MLDDWALVMIYFALFFGAGLLLRTVAAEPARQLVRIRNKTGNEKDKY